MNDVFAALDRTESSLGQHALYHRLRTAPAALHLEAFEALVQRLTRDAAARERAQLILARLQDLNGYDVWWLADPDAIDTPPWFVVFPVLTVVTITLALLAPFWASAWGPLLMALALNVAVRYRTDLQVGTIARTFRQCAPVVATGESLRFLSGDDIDPLVAALRLDTPSLATLKSISRWVSGDPLMLPAGAGPLILLLNDLVSTVYEYLNLAFMLDGTGVYVAVRHLSQNGTALTRVAAAAGEVDAAIGVASFRAGRPDWILPDFQPTGAVSAFTDLRHPLVADAVANSIELTPGHGAIITGSNMSGKSTFLRTVGVNAVLAQTVHTCLASVYRAPILDVRSCIGRADDLLAGKSYYLAEVEALLELVAASNADAPHLFLLDELFRGTNAVERIAAGDAVLQELLQTSSGASKPHIVLTATHDGELVDLAARFDVYHFGDSIDDASLTFDHRLRRGPTASRNAIALLSLSGAPDTLVRRARATADMLDRQRGTMSPSA